MFQIPPDLFLNLTANDYWYFLTRIHDLEASQGNSVLFSTHVLSVAEQICDRIGILKKGKLIFQGSIAELKHQYPDKDLETIYLEMAGRKAEEV